MIKFLRKNSKIVKIFSLILIIFLLFVAQNHDVNAPSIPAFENLVVNVGADASTLNFNWLCDAEILGTPTVKILGIQKPFVGIQGLVDENTKYNKVIVTGLDSDMTYQCQVSSDGINYSETYILKTSSLDSFTFAVVGDPQIGASSNLFNDSANWAITVNEIKNHGAFFIIGVGDQVDYQGDESGSAILRQQYSNFIDGLTQERRLMPYAATIGNHEGYRASWIGREMFNYCYNIANKSTDVVLYDFKLVNYYYIYNNTLFVVLDTAPYPNPADTAFTKSLVDEYDKILSKATTAFANQYNWLVVQTHKSVQCNPADYMVDDIEAYSRAGFEDVMTKYDVDLVLAGHAHSYIRTYPFKSNATAIGTGGPMITDGITIDVNNLCDDLMDPDGTVYMVLNSASGSEFYDIDTTPKLTSKIEVQNYIPQYTIINVMNQQMIVTTYEVGFATPVDYFTITKTKK